MSWEAFLTKIAIDFGLSPGQIEVFLIRFNEENKGRRDVDVQKLLEAQLNLECDAYKKRKREIFAKFEWGKQNLDGCETLKNAGPHKHKRLLKWLEDRYKDFAAKQATNEFQPTFDWALACQKKLEKQVEDRLLRRQATEQGFEIDVHVGLGLVERKQQQRRNQTDRASLYKLTDPIAKGKTYGHEQFLSEVIGRSASGKNKHIAIVGEPGAGKTTLLVAIAQHLINPKSKSEALPIFVSLAGLQGKSLKNYILQDWLPEAVRLVDPTAKIAELQDLFQQWFYQQPVWLLLDAVDEMGETSPAKALSSIQSQLTDWLGQVRVALTCRLNVWDASLSNPLVGFETYKTQEFEPNQVQEFIGKWFEQAEKPQQGETLWRELQEPQRDRVRELARNPLRLSLLCQIFHTNPDETLPQTKAGLYQQFVQYFYEWKEEQHSTTTAQRRQLNEALGKLALAALDGQHGLQQFRIPERSACEVMGEEWFGLAKDLGWLNIVDRISGTNEPVYAFFHATFQEYFAALSIRDWDCFLPRHHCNKPIENNQGKCKYRIFDSLWESVITLWIGRENISTNDKVNFIDRLFSFQDGCNGFYSYQACFLVSDLFQEFHEHDASSKFINRLVLWALGEPDQESGEWQCFRQPIAQASLEAARKFSRKDLIKTLDDYTAFTNLPEDKRQQIISYAIGVESEMRDFRSFLDVARDIYLNDVKSENIDSIILNLNKSNDFNVVDNAILYLRSHQIWDSRVINKLTELLENGGSDWSVNRKILGYFNDIALSNPKLISQNQTLLTKLVNTHKNCRDELLQKSILHLFSKAFCGNEIVIEYLIDYLILLKDRKEFNLSEGSAKNYSDELEKIINLVKYSGEYSKTVESLALVDPGNKLAFDELLNRLSTHQYARDSSFTISALKKTMSAGQMKLAVKALKRFISLEKYQVENPKHFSSCYDIVWHCAQNMSYLEFYNVWNDAESAIEEIFYIEDILTKLQTEDHIFLVRIKLSASIDQTENTIAKRLWTRIYSQAFPDRKDRPKIEDLGDLEQELLSLENELQVEKLAIIFYDCEPHPNLISLLNQLTDFLHIGWITNQPVPFRSFHPDPIDTLASRIQSWLDEL